MSGLNGLQLAGFAPEQQFKRHAVSAFTSKPQTKEFSLCID